MNQTKGLNESILTPVTGAAPVKGVTMKIVSSSQLDSVDVYANGNMQAQAIIYIEAVDINDKHIELTQKQLDSIQLFTYKTHQDLSVEQTYYDTVENEFSHDYSMALQAKPELLSSNEKVNGMQQKVYWIRTAKTGGTAIVAAITLEGKTFYSDSPGVGDKYLVINGKTCPTYGIDDFEIKIYPNHANGVYYGTVGSESGGVYLSPKYTQDDYYIYLNHDKHPNLTIKKIDISNTASDNPEDIDNYRRCGLMRSNKTSQGGMFYFLGDFFVYNPFGTRRYDLTSGGHDYIFQTQVGKTPDPETAKGTIFGSFLRLENFDSDSGYSWNWFDGGGAWDPYFIAYDQYGNPSNQIRVVQKEHDPDDENPTPFTIILSYN